MLIYSSGEKGAETEHTLQPDALLDQYRFAVLSCDRTPDEDARAAMIAFKTSYQLAIKLLKAQRALQVKRTIVRKAATWSQNDSASAMAISTPNAQTVGIWALVTALEREASSLRLRLVASEERATRSVNATVNATHNERLAAARELEQGCTAPGAADNEELRTLRRRVDAQEQERRAVLSILERRLKPGLEAARTQLQAHQVHSAQHELAALSELVMRSIAALQTDNPYSAH
jgi:hypothetical protein